MITENSASATLKAIDFGQSTFFKKGQTFNDPVRWRRSHQRLSSSSPAHLGGKHCGSAETRSERYPRPPSPGTPPTAAARTARPSGHAPSFNVSDPSRACAACRWDLHTTSLQRCSPPAEFTVRISGTDTGSSAVLQMTDDAPRLTPLCAWLPSAPGPLADEWAAGVILYVLLCGFPPFYAEDKNEIYKLILVRLPCLQRVFPFTQSVSCRLSAGLALRLRTRGATLCSAR